MKLASLPQRRDGRPIVVSHDLAWYADADHIVPTLQAALDEWERYEPLLETLSTELEHAAIPRRRFHEREACSPLPRTYRRISDGRDFPGDDLAPGRSELVGPVAASGVELCAVTGEVGKGATPAQAGAAVRLVGLVHDAGLGALSPALALPDMLSREGLVLSIEVDGERVVTAEIAPPDFGASIAALAAARRLGPGTIVGCGPVAQVPALSPGQVVRIEMRCGRERSLFGAFERSVVAG